mgnify:CR=1 FL=1
MVDNVITTSGLTRRYKKITVVDNLNLSVPQGAVFGFLGPNGAGKTTTIRMLLGLIHPNQGQVLLFGLPFEKNRNAVLRRIGALVETPSFYSHLTGYENLEVTRRLINAQKKQISRVLRIVNLEKDADRHVREYSLGMRQRLGLALALINEPSLLILDEPTNGLDPAGIQEIRELIRNFPSEYGVTVFVSSHLLGEVEQIATHIGIIREGHMLFQGTLEDLKAQQREYIQVGVSEPEKAVRILKTAGWSVQVNKDEFLTVIANKRSDALQINRLLKEQGIEIFHLAAEQPSLERIFLRLTNVMEKE